MLSTIKNSYWELKISKHFCPRLSIKLTTNQIGFLALFSFIFYTNIHLRLLTHVKVSVRCLFKGSPIQSFSVVIAFSTFVVFIFKGN